MSSLVEFLKERKYLREESAKRRQELLEEWTEALSKLFDKIEKWLEPAKREGLDLKRCEVEISEEPLGTYRAPALEIRFADITVRLEPIARMVLGAYGRIDIYSPLGIHKLVRLNMEGNKWYLILSEPDEKRPFTKEALEDFLKEAFSVP